MCRCFCNCRVLFPRRQSVYKSVKGGGGRSVFHVFLFCFRTFPLRHTHTHTHTHTQTQTHTHTHTVPFRHLHHWKRGGVSHGRCVSVCVCVCEHTCTHAVAHSEQIWRTKLHTETIADVRRSMNTLWTRYEHAMNTHTATVGESVDQTDTQHTVSKRTQT
jgi:hypothetical protein